MPRAPEKTFTFLVLEHERSWSVIKNVLNRCFGAVRMFSLVLSEGPGGHIVFSQKRSYLYRLCYLIIHFNISTLTAHTQQPPLFPFPSRLTYSVISKTILFSLFLFRLSFFVLCYVLLIPPWDPVCLLCLFHISFRAAATVISLSNICFFHHTIFHRASHSWNLNCDSPQTLFILTIFRRNLFTLPCKTFRRRPVADPWITSARPAIRIVTFASDLSPTRLLVARVESGWWMAGRCKWPGKVITNFA